MMEEGSGRQLPPISLKYYVEQLRFDKTLKCPLLTLLLAAVLGSSNEEEGDGLVTKAPPLSFMASKFGAVPMRTAT